MVVIIIIVIVSDGLVTSKSNLQLLVTSDKKVTSYLISYFSEKVTSYNYYTFLVTLLQKTKVKNLNASLT